MIDLKKYLPNYLKNDFWFDFLDCISDELNLFKSYIEEKLKFFNPRKIDNEKYLSEICKFEGFFVNRNLNNSFSFYKNEVINISNKILNKTTYLGYEQIFKKTFFNENSTDYYSGFVYNLFYDGCKLIKALDKSYISSKIVINELYKPFLFLKPTYFYSNKINQQTLFDKGLIFDNDSGWYLDDFLTNMVTKHLDIELIPSKLQVINGKDYLILDKHLDYVLSESKSIKKATEFVNVGIQIIIPCFSSYRGYDYLDGSNGYTIPSLKINCVSTNFLALTNSMFPKIYFDSNHIFDNNPLWYLDNDSLGMGARPINELFFGITYGVGFKNLVGRDNKGLIEGIFGRWGFDEDFGDIVFDSSYYNRSGKIYGLYHRANDLLSKCLYFNGINTYVKIDWFNIPDKDICLWFWVKGSINDQVNDIVYIVYTEKIKVAIDKVNSVIKVEVGNCIFNIEKILDNQEYCFVFNIDKNNDKVDCYINGSLFLSKTSANIGGILQENKPLFFGAGANGSNFYKGYLDDINFKEGLLKESEIQTLYIKRICDVSFLEKKRGFDYIRRNEILDLGNFYLISTKIRGNYILNEPLFISDGITSVYNGFLNEGDIIPSSVIINYNYYSSYREIKDDGFGGLFGDNCYGSINYDTGEYEIRFYQIYRENGQELIPSLNYNSNLGRNNIVLDSLKLVYEINGNIYQGVSSITGVISGIGIATGFVQENGDLVLNFNLLPTFIKVSYSYKVINIPTIGIPVLARYQVKYLPITEIGIVDIQYRNVCYATLPKAEIKDSKYHYGINFLISKF